MSARTLDRLLAGTHPDPDGGAPLKIDTRSVVIAKSLAGQEGELVTALNLGRRIAVVSDTTTHAILGHRVEAALAGKLDVLSILLPEHPHPDDATVATVRSATATADAIIAVGSGTINDLCKYASALDRKPYAVFGTAPSMNGYGSLNAAITVGGLKKSLAAQAPIGIFFDVSIMAAAPARMIRSGLGDSLCRPTAQADWLLAHLLLDLPYRTMPFVLLEEDETGLFDGAADLMEGNHEAMEYLLRTLLLSGFGTAICGNSLPASQGEHLISHYMEMMAGDRFPFSFHGEQIAVTTLTSARLQEEMLSGPAPVISASAESEAGFVGLFGPILGTSCWREYAQKDLRGARREEINHRLSERWAQIVAAISKIILPATRLDQVLAAAKAPRSPADLGWERNFYREAVRSARCIRNRYTFLDLAADSGVLDQSIDRIT
jgi:glycerol-1-phosphate dehydrogenase [NAD(P)+]